MLSLVFPFSFSQYIGQETCSTPRVTHTTPPYVPLEGTSYRVLLHAGSLITGWKVFFLNNSSSCRRQAWIFDWQLPIFATRTDLSKAVSERELRWEDVQGGQSSGICNKAYSISEIFKNAFWTIKGVNVRIQKTFFPCFRGGLKYISSFPSPFFSSLQVKAFAESSLPHHYAHLFLRRVQLREADRPRFFLPNCYHYWLFAMCQLFVNIIPFNPPKHLMRYTF